MAEDSADDKELSSRSGSDDKEEEEIEMLASSRERRNNAGAKMSQLIQSEETVDDFYMSAYGGFDEDEEDLMYSSSSSDDDQREDSDSTDSDFDIDEREASGSDKEEEDKPSRKRRLVTKTYKEPDSTVGSEPKKKRPRRERNILDETDRKTRKSTTQQTKHMSQKRQLTIERYKAKRRKYHLMLSQEELLEESKQTEEINLKSLEKYRQLELEMKTKRNRASKRKGIQGEKITYLSLSIEPPKVSTPVDILADIPLDVMESCPIQTENNSSAVGSESQLSNAATEPPTTVEENEKLLPEKYSRNFIVFSNDYSLRKNFPSDSELKKSESRKKEFCVVTGEPAKYRDPLTKLPYANATAFMKLREAYEAHVMAEGNKDDPAVSEWLRWKNLKAS